MVVCAWLVVAFWSIIFATFHRVPRGNFELPELEHTLLDGHQQKLQAQLESALRRVQELEQTIREQQLQQQQQLSRKLPQTSPQVNCTRQDKEQILHDDSALSSLDVPPFSSQNPVCRALPHPVPNAAALWTQYIPQIHKASQIPNDHRYYFHDFTAQLLHLVSPRLSHTPGRN